MEMERVKRQRAEILEEALLVRERRRELMKRKREKKLLDVSSSRAVCPWTSGRYSGSRFLNCLVSESPENTRKFGFWEMSSGRCAHVQRRWLDSGYTLYVGL